MALPGGCWLDPCAGDGAIIQAVNDVRRNVIWTAVECRPECEASLQAAGAADVQIDSFTTPTRPLRLAPFDVVLTNPPFRAAMAFAKQALTMSNLVVFLLRLNWLGGAARQDFLRRHLSAVFVLPNRPSFVDGRTDATEYAWMVFEPEPNERVLDILPVTPAGARAGSPARVRGQQSLDLGAP